MFLCVNMSALYFFWQNHCQLCFMLLEISFTYLLTIRYLFQNIFLNRKKNDNQQQKVDLLAICARPTLKMFVFLRLFRKHFQRFNRERFFCFKINKIINVSTVPSFFLYTKYLNTVNVLSNSGETGMESIYQKCNNVSNWLEKKAAIKPGEISELEIDNFVLSWENTS